MNSILKQIIPSYADDDWDGFIEWIYKQDFSRELKMGVWLKQNMGHCFPNHEDQDFMYDAETLLTFVDNISKKKKRLDK